jgi:hypothetical protein
MALGAILTSVYAAAVALLRREAEVRAPDLHEAVLAEGTRFQSVSARTTKCWRRFDHLR